MALMLTTTLQQRSQTVFPQIIASLRNYFQNVSEIEIFTD